MQLVGVPIRDDDVRELVDALWVGGFEDVAHKLEHAIAMETKVLALTIPDREGILRVLDDPPETVAELRGVLVQEHGDLCDIPDPRSQAKSA
ncbi:MAG: hypothetical protein H0T97_11190 [Actinobacteria bacterium]|nr:hypothetical protein [Actinomycetota bacterium]